LPAGKTRDGFQFKIRRPIAEKVVGSGTNLTDQTDHKS